MRNDRQQVRSRQRSAYLLGQPVGEDPIVVRSDDQAERDDGDDGRDVLRCLAVRTAIEREDLLRVLPDATKPFVEADFLDVDAFEEFTVAGTADEFNLGQIKRNFRIGGRDKLGIGAAHHLFDVRQRPAKALPSSVVTGRAPQRILQICASSPPERCGRQQGKKRLMLGAGDLEISTGRRTNDASPKQIDL